jgi:hypothetical protein
VRPHRRHARPPAPDTRRLRRRSNQETLATMGGEGTRHANSPERSTFRRGRCRPSAAFPGRRPVGGVPRSASAPSLRGGAVASVARFLPRRNARYGSCVRIPEWIGFGVGMDRDGPGNSGISGWAEIFPSEPEKYLTSKRGLTRMPSCSARWRNQPLVYITIR